MSDFRSFGKVADVFRCQMSEERERWRAGLEERIESLKTQLDSTIEGSKAYLDLASC